MSELTDEIALEAKEWQGLGGAVTGLLTAAQDLDPQITQVFNELNAQFTALHELENELQARIQDELEWLAAESGERTQEWCEEMVGLIDATVEELSAELSDLAERREAACTEAMMLMIKHIR